MNEIACCPLSGAYDSDPPKCYSSAVRRAAREHRCCECHEPIQRSDRYEHVKGMWDGQWATYKTCLTCVEIRNHFACEGWIFEQLWSDLEENYFPGMKAGGPCMEGLSPVAKRSVVRASPSVA